MNPVIQERIDQLDLFLSTTVTYPEAFADVVVAREWIEEEIMQLEADQLAEIEQEKSCRPGQLNQGNVIIPIVPQWSGGGKVESKTGWYASP